ncbi:ankyrin-3-like [Culicoides brevitarsis]|uniref:ankyrin-3-like n=1 Tax=Culicoides brevitarsis TaxID=469753 RepID=UPI00307C01EF
METPIAEALEHVAFLQTLNRLCENNQHELILSVLQANKSAEEYLSLLLLISFPNCVTCVEIFIDNLPAEAIEKPGSLGRNALIAAIVLGENNFAVIETLVKYKKGVLVNVPDALGRTAVHYAVIKGDTKIVKLLCEEGNANPDHIDNDGNTILHQFFLFNVKNAELLGYLMRGKPQQHKMLNVHNSKAQGKSTPGMLAMGMNSPYMSQLFREMRDIPPERHPTVERRKMALDLSLYEIQDGDLNELKFIIEKFGDSVDGNGDTLLHSFAKFGLSNKSAIDYCLRRPSNALEGQINAQNREGKTPLYVLLEGPKKASEMLFEALFEHPSLDLTIRDSMGWTVLKPAVKQSKEIFLKIYDSNPNLFFALNLNDMNVFIYMFEIINKEPFELLKALVEDHGLDLTSIDDLGRNIFHYCAEFGKNKPYIYDYLYSKLPVSPQTMINVKAKDCYGYTPMMLAIISGNDYFFKHLFAKYDVDLTLKPNSGFNANYLTLAIKHSSLDIQLQILKRCPELVDFVSDLGITPVMIAIAESKLELTKILINEYNVDITVKNSYGNTILHYLANHRVKDTELIELLLNGDRNVAFYINERNEDGLTPFDIAMQKENIELANAFAKYLTTEADVAQIDVKDVTNEKPLVISQVDGFLATFQEESLFDDLRTLIEKNDLEGVKTYMSSRNLPEVLHFISAIQNIGPNIIDFLLHECPKTRENVNYQNKNGDTALHCAAVREHIPLLNALLKHPEINTKIQNKKGETALLAAINNTWVKFSEDVIRMLVMHEPSLVHIPDFYGVTPLQAAILHDHFNVLRLVVEKGANLHYVDSDEDTLAHFLAGYKAQDPKMIEFLMNKPNNVLKHINKRNKHGNTPLHAACKMNNEKYVNYLLAQRRIDLLRVNNMNETPLFVCLSVNRKTASAKIIDELVKKCPGMVSKPNFVGDLPILLALNVENHDVIKVLIEDGRIDVNIWRDRQQNTLLHYLFLYEIKDRNIYKLLIDKGQLVINHPNNLGDTILHFACRDHLLDIVHLLIQCPDVDFSLQNSKGDTPLLELLKPGQNNVDTTILVKLLISLFPATKHMKNYRGVAPIHKALESGLFDAAPCLLPITDDARDFTDNAGNNLLHYLARYANSDEKLIRKFLQGMSQPEIERIVNNARNNDGKTALDLAREFKNDIFLNEMEIS